MFSAHCSLLIVRPSKTAQRLQKYCLHQNDWPFQSCLKPTPAYSLSAHPELPITTPTATCVSFRLYNWLAISLPASVDTGSLLPSCCSYHSSPNFSPEEREKLSPGFLQGSFGTLVSCPRPWKYCSGWEHSLCNNNNNNGYLVFLTCNSPKCL